MISLSLIVLNRILGDYPHDTCRTHLITYVLEGDGCWGIMPYVGLGCAGWMVASRVEADSSRAWGGEWSGWGSAPL